MLENLKCVNNFVNLDKYLTLYKYVKDNMEHPEWLGIFTKEKIIRILNNDGKIWLYYDNKNLVCSMFYMPIFRETREKIKRFKDLGAVCVEMEGTAIAAVCNYLNLDYFTFYYAGDNLDCSKWDERSLSGLTNFNQKQKVKKLAFELAKEIENKSNN